MDNDNARYVAQLQEKLRQLMAENMRLKIAIAKRDERIKMLENRGRNGY